MNNPYYVKPATGGMQPALQGIGNLITGVAKKSRQEEAARAFQQAYESNDPAAIAKIATENPAYAQSLIGLYEHKNDATKQSRRNMLFAAAQNPDSLVDQMIKHKSIIEEQGGESDITDEDILLAQDDPNAAMQQVVNDLAAYDPEGYKALAPSLPGYVDPEFRKELRNRVDVEINKFNNEAQEMVSSYNSMERLAKASYEGDRGARNMMTVKLVRLASPGIVTESEAAQAIGGQSSWQAIANNIANIAKGKGMNFDQDAFLRSVDPYGQGFNTSAMLRSAQSLVSAGAPALLARFEDSRSRAQKGGMYRNEMETYFDESGMYKQISDYANNPVKEFAPDPAVKQLYADIAAGDMTAATEFQEYYGYLPYGIEVQ